MEWKDIKKELPTIGSLVVAWLEKAQIPVCCRIERDEIGLLWTELSL